MGTCYRSHAAKNAVLIDRDSIIITNHCTDINSERISPKYQYFIKRGTAQLRKKKLKRSMFGYGSYLNGMIRKAEEGMNDQQRYLRWMDYKMKNIKDVTDETVDLDHVQRDIFDAK